MQMKSFLKAISSLLVSFIFINQCQASAWDDYKSKYLKDDGAIVDTYNNHMSHSEGQGYGLLFALKYNDKSSFDKILNWTYQHLYNPKTGLFYWAYHHNAQEPIPDKNNASDGDLFIAWTLLQASKQWNNQDYLKKGETLANLLLNLTVTKFGQYNIILPGVNGFYYNSYVVVNPSYYIYPAFLYLQKHTHVKTWKDLNQDGKALLSNLNGQKIKLAPDWLKLYQDGNNMPSENWPANSSYDAIRVPLYLYWENPNNQELKVYREYYQNYLENTPAYVNVLTGQSANYAMTSGLKAVRNLVLGYKIDEPNINLSEDYYNASLSMLCYLAYKDHH